MLTLQQRAAAGAEYGAADYHVAADLGAYVARFQLTGADSGALAGVSVAVQDLFDIAGQVTGCGNPDWAASHGPAPATAPAVHSLLAAGAVVNGKTVTDELAYSLTGENAHYGTPLNPAAPGRIPGGSSSGSAVAVAGRLADTALGTDTGGSVRLPAAFCGLYGMRPSHGRISLDGVMPLAPSFDTVGWFARDMAMLDRVGRVLLGDPDPGPAPHRVLLVEDAFALASSDVRGAVGPAIDAVTAALGPPRDVAVSDHGLDRWMDAFRLIQGAEIWRNHGAWIEQTRPHFGPGVAQRFAWAASIDPSAVATAMEQRELIAARLDRLLADGAVLCLPTQPALPPLLRSDQNQLSAFRSAALCLLSIAGLGRLPQITLPLAGLGGRPVGLSLIGRRGSDAALLAAARRIRF